MAFWAIDKIKILQVPLGWSAVDFGISMLDPVDNPLKGPSVNNILAVRFQHFRRRKQQFIQLIITEVFQFFVHVKVTTGPNNTPLPTTHIPVVGGYGALLKTFIFVQN